MLPVQQLIDETKIFVAVLGVFPRRNVVCIGDGVPMLLVEAVGIRGEIGREILELGSGQARYLAQIGEDRVRLLLLIDPLLFGIGPLRGDLTFETADSFGRLIRLGLGIFGPVLAAVLVMLA